MAKVAGKLKIPSGYKPDKPTYKVTAETHYYPPVKGVPIKMLKRYKSKPMEVTVVSIRGNKGLSKRKRGR